MVRRYHRSLMGTASAAVTFSLATASIPAHTVDPSFQDSNSSVTPATPQSETDAQARTPDRIAQAKALFEEVVKAYRSAPAIRDTSKVTIKSVMGGGDSRTEELVIPIIIAPNSAKFTLRENITTVTDGTLYVENTKRADRYFAQDFEGAIVVDPFMSQADMVPIPQFVAAYAPDPLVYLSVYTINPRFGGLRTVFEAEERELKEIIVDSDDEGAPIRMRIDPRTNLIVRYETHIRGRGMIEGEGIHITAEMSPELLTEEPAGEFVVTTSGKRAVSNIGRLLAPPDTTDLVGQQAPDFTAVGGEGSPSMRLSDQVGKTVVIVWWTVQSEGLMPVLAAAQAVADWAKEEGAAVVTMPIYWGPIDDDVRLIWKEEGYRMSMLSDPEGKTADAYRLPLLPVIVVVRPDGGIHEAFVDMTTTTDLKENLKLAVQTAIRTGL